MKKLQAKILIMEEFNNGIWSEQNNQSEKLNLFVFGKNVH